MEAREEKLLMARASFRNEGSPKCFRTEEKKVETQNRGKGMFLLRLIVALLLFGAFVYSDDSNISKINEISHKSFEEIRKEQINIEKYSAILGKMW